MTLRAAVIGVGKMGQHHARIYSDLPGVELAAIVDPDPSKADLAKSYGCAHLADPAKLKNIDLASVCVPTTLHHSVASGLLRAGIDVLIEKPIAATAAEATALVELAEKEGRTAMVGHIERFNPAIAKTKDLIAAGTLKNLLTLSAIRVGPHDPRIRDVGIIIDSATHDIDVMQHLLGRAPSSVFAKAVKVVNPKEDYAFLTLDYGITTGSIEANWFTPYKLRTLTIITPQKVLKLDYITQRVQLFEGDSPTEVPVSREEPLLRELRHFAECVEHSREPLTSFREGARALATALAAIRSAETGLPVPIEP